MDSSSPEKVRMRDGPPCFLSLSPPSILTTWPRLMHTLGIAFNGDSIASLATVFVLSQSRETSFRFGRAKYSPGAKTFVFLQTTPPHSLTSRFFFSPATISFGSCKFAVIAAVCSTVHRRINSAIRSLVIAARRTGNSIPLIHRRRVCRTINRPATLTINALCLQSIHIDPTLLAKHTLSLELSIHPSINRDHSNLDPVCTAVSPTPCLKGRGTGSNPRVLLRTHNWSKDMGNAGSRNNISHSSIPMDPHELTMPTGPTRPGWCPVPVLSKTSSTCGTRLASRRRFIYLRRVALDIQGLKMAAMLSRTWA